MFDLTELLLACKEHSMREPWVSIYDENNEEDIIVRQSSIKSITCDSLNLEDVHWYVRVDSGSDNGTELIRVYWKHAFQLLKILNITVAGGWFKCPECGSVAYWYTDHEEGRMGLACLKYFEEHNTYAKTSAYKVRPEIVDAFCDRKFGDIDQYYEKENEND